jgi:hypothetical protein
MSDGKHTPGPWVADWTIRSGSDERQARGWHVHNGNDTEPVICDIPDDGRHDGCRVANARLIAEAPMLLAACEMVLMRWGTTDFESVHDAGVIDDIKRIVARATGQ